MSNSNNNLEESVDIFELLKVIWAHRMLIFISLIIFSSISFVYSRALPDLYTSKAIVAPANPNESLTSQLGGYSALAGLAGVNIPIERLTPADEAIERIWSFDFFKSNFLPFIKLEDLLAAKNWDESSNTIKYNKSIFSKEKNKWSISKNNLNEIVPSDLQAYDQYKKILKVTQDSKTQFVTIAIEHQSPYISRDWVNLIISNINSSFSERDKLKALNSIDFLNDSLSKTNLNEIKEAISQLLESQLQNLMLASSNKNYVFKIIDSPYVPEKISSPKRKMILLYGAILGIIFGIIISFTKHRLQKAKSFKNF